MDCTNGNSLHLYHAHRILDWQWSFGIYNHLAYIAENIYLMFQIDKYKNVARKINSKRFILNEIVWEKKYICKSRS